jgi:preprotein translocase subunit YajC|tara:strand:- start:8550 stop:8924 length:375 start_codon:yes stop_codon:yes gene_type:complete
MKRKKSNTNIKLFLLFVLMAIIFYFAYSTPSTAEEHKLQKLDAILTYCDTHENITKMATESYQMGVAARGLVHNKFHKELITVEMWINPNNDQWAIIFKYKHKNLSCIVGGNSVKLFTPKGTGV